MKKTILIALMALIGLSAFAQSAQQVLDRTSKVIGNKRCKRQLHHIKCENRFEQRHYCHQRKQIQCPYATSYRMVQRKDSMVISEEDQRGKHLHPNPGSTDGNEPLYLY